MYNKALRPWPLWLALVASFVFLPGCPLQNEVEPQKEVTFQHEAGSSHVAVLAVAPWDKVRESLEPKFELKAQEALDAVLPLSAKIKNMAYRGLGAQARVATPTVKDLVSNKKTVTNGEKTSEKTSTHTEEPGDPSQAPEGSTLPERKALGEMAEALTSEGLETDPLLKYLAATALLQEVQLLNQYLKYAPMAKGYKPYLVRLQISLMPNARNMPYDAYTILSFFPQDTQLLTPSSGEEDQATPVKRASLSTLATAGRDQDIDTKALNAGDSAAAAKNSPAQVVTSPCERQASSGQEQKETGHTGHLPRVIPMLVSDSLEAADYARSQETLTRIALGVSAMLQGVGMEANFESNLNKLKAATSLDFNSLFSMAQISPNTLRVRMGAYRQGVKAYTMVPRTHTVNLLLLVPEDYFAGGVKECDLTVMSKTVFVNALEGDSLRVRSEDTALQGAKETAQEYVPAKNWPMLDRTYNPCQPGRTAVQFLISHVNHNKFMAFADIAKHLGVPPSRLYSFWVDMVSTRCGGLYNMAYFPVPAPAKSTDPTPHKDVTAWLRDDGKQTTEAKVSLAMPEGKKLCPEDQSGDSCVRITKVALQIKTTDPALYLPSKNGFNVKEDKAEFDSLKSWGLKAGDLAGKIFLIASWESGKTSGSDAYPGYYALDKPEKAKPNLAVSTNTYAVMAKDNKGSLNINLTVAEGYKAAGNNALAVKVVGADVESTEPTVTPSGGLVPVSGSGTITLKLANLKVYEPVKLVPMEGNTALEGSVCLPVCGNVGPRDGTLCLPMCPPKSN